MQVVSGTKLGPYEILALIGSGGMGEVWKAHDSRLGRDVAIKVSKEHFSERFDREARVIATLNHPHICTLYDVGPNYLVMEYIEGAPLKTPLPLDQAIRTAIQICGALDAAHSKGITHRDLKPGNILVTRAGVKLLDFGLAKVDAGVQSNPADAMTAITAKGEIVGTLYYMAPEQLQGNRVDFRSDIFSFGVVLYEMLMGKHAFEGGSPASIIAAILERPAPSISSVAPPALDRLLHRCLAKVPDDRWQSARDLQAELEWIASSDPVPQHAIARRSIVGWMAVGVAGSAVGASLTAFALRKTGVTAPSRAIRFRLSAPEGALLQRVVTRQSLAISPTGGTVAMIATDDSGSVASSRIWIHRFGSVTPTPLAGTEGAQIVFWQPEGKFIGFWADGKLKKIPADGGTALTIRDIPTAWSATWGQNDTIVVAVGAAFTSVSLASGAIGKLMPGAWPRFLPDGRRLLYLAGSKERGLHAWVADLASGAQTELMPTDTQVIFVPDQSGDSDGYLVFGRGSVLQAVRFDADSILISGDAVPVAKDVPFYMGNHWSEFDASADHILVYSTGAQREQLKWFDRKGRESGLIGDSRDFGLGLRLSSDGRKLAAAMMDAGTGGSDVWVYDLETATDERITSGPGVEQWPVWSPDGARIAFSSGTYGPSDMSVKALNGRGDGQTFAGREFRVPRDWSSDGAWIFYTTAPTGSNGQIRLAFASDGKTVSLLKSPYDNAFPTLSPDGKYLAWSANDTGRHEIYVQRFQVGDAPTLVGERYRVSRNGGNVPRWRRDGKELFFISPDRRIVAVPVERGAAPVFGPPVALFSLPPSSTPLGAQTAGYDVSPDGQRFVVLTGGMGRPPLEMAVNWQADLKK